MASPLLVEASGNIPTQPETPRQTALLPGLNALRAVAVALVITFHLVFPWVSGPLGVMIFFVLSGYLITGILHREFERDNWIDLRRFYWRRAYRILPAFYAAWLLFTVLMLYHHEPIVWKHAVGSLFFLTDYLRALNPSPYFQVHLHMGIAWSLAIEEQFYFIWPVMMRTMMLRNGKRILTNLAIIIGALWVYRSAMYVTGRIGNEYAYNAFDTRIDALLIGAWFAIAHRTPGRLNRLTRHRWVIFVPLGFLGLVACREQAWINWMSRSQFLLQWTLQPVIIGVLIVQLVTFGRRFHWYWLDTPIITFLAGLSYALYLFHIASLDPLFEWISANQITRSLLVSFVLAAGSYYMVERPFMRLRDKRHPGR